MSFQDPSPCIESVPNYALPGKVPHLPMLSTINSGSEVFTQPPASSPMIHEALSPLYEVRCCLQSMSPCMGSQHLQQAQVLGPGALIRDTGGPHPLATPCCHCCRSCVSRYKLSQPYLGVRAWPQLHTNRWDGPTQTLIPEMGLYDHLVLSASDSRISPNSIYTLVQREATL